MSTTKKDENKVDLTTPTNPLQEQGKKIEVEVNDKPDYYPTERIPQQEDYRKQNPFQDKQSESIIPYKEEVESVEPFDFNQAYKDAKNEVDMTRSLHDAEREGEERRQNNRRIMTAIGDGLSGLANIYFTSQGTPDLLKGAPSLSGKMQERYDKMRKDAETRRANYLKVVRESADQKVKDMYTRYKDGLEAKRKEEELELKRKKDARDEIKAEVEAEKARLYNDYLQGRISEQEWKTKTAEAEAKNAPTYYENRAKKAGSIGSRGGSRGGSGGSGRGAGKYSAYGADGKLYYFPSLHDAKQFAMNEGTWKDSQSSGGRDNRTTTPGYSQNPNRGAKPTGKKASSVSYKRKKNT